MMDIAVPVVAICLAVTTLQVDDASHSTVATQELQACAICNRQANGGTSAECPEPPWMDEARKLAAILNKMPGQKKKSRKDARR